MNLLLKLTITAAVLALLGGVSYVVADAPARGRPTGLIAVVLASPLILLLVTLAHVLRRPRIFNILAAGFLPIVAVPVLLFIDQVAIQPNTATPNSISGFSNMMVPLGTVLGFVFLVRWLRYYAIAVFPFYYFAMFEVLHSVLYITGVRFFMR
jgi:hypothetical protein